MEVFNAYCEDLTFLSDDIQKNLSSLKGMVGSSSSSSSNDSTAADSLCRTIQSIFDQLDETVKQAEMEARSLESKDRKSSNDRLRQFKDNFQSLRNKFDSTVYELQRSHLVGKTGEDRGRMLDVNQKIRNQNAIIEQACRTVAESEDIGAETVEELKRNREKIEEIREKNREFTSTVDDADKKLKSMWFRHKTWGLFG